MKRSDVKKEKPLGPAVADTITSESRAGGPFSAAEQPEQSQQFCVRWSSHQTNLQRAFPKLLMSESFVDVTLACEHNMIKCHKVVLSASSSYFEKLLQSTACKHPIIFLKDMKFSELKTLVDFIYRGQVNVNQDELKSLMKSAEALEIRGLNGTNRTYLDRTSEECVRATEKQQQQLSPKPEAHETLENEEFASMPCENQQNGSVNVADETDVKVAGANDPSNLGLKQPLLKTSANGDVSLRNNRASGSGTETAVNVPGHDRLVTDCERDAIRPSSDTLDHQPEIEMDETDDYETNGGCADGGGSGDYDDHEDTVYDDEDEEDNDNNDDDDNDDIEQNVLNRVTCHISEVPGGNRMDMFSSRYQPGPDFMMSMMGTRRIRRTEDELKKAAEQIIKGQTFQMVSDRFNIPISTIRFYMARKGILPQRKRGRSCSTTSATNPSSGMFGMTYEPHRNNCSSPTDPPYHIAHYKLPMLDTNFK